MNAPLRISLSSTILWLVFMVNAKVGLFCCSAAGFHQFIHVELELQVMRINVVRAITPLNFEHLGKLQRLHFCFHSILN